MFEGDGTYGGLPPNGWRNSFLEADLPFQLVASGSIGRDLSVEYFDGTHPLKVIRQHGENPYRVTLEGLPPGLHSLYAVTTVNGAQEISRPVTFLFSKRR